MNCMARYRRRIVLIEKINVYEFTTHTNTHACVSVTVQISQSLACSWPHSRLCLASVQSNIRIRFFVCELYVYECLYLLQYGSKCVNCWLLSNMLASITSSAGWLTADAVRTLSRRLTSHIYHYICVCVMREQHDQGIENMRATAVKKTNMVRGGAFELLIPAEVTDFTCINIEYPDYYWYI